MKGAKSDGREDTFGAISQEPVRRKIKWKQHKPEKFVNSREVYTDF